MILKLEQNRGAKPEQDQKVKEILALAEARKKARRWLDYLKKERPQNKKVDLLPYVHRVGGPIALQILAEEVDRQKLSVKDRIGFEDFKKKFLSPKEAPNFST